MSELQKAIAKIPVFYGDFKGIGCDSIVRLSDLKEVFDRFDKTHDILPKREEWEESVGEAFQKMHDEINRKLKFHGIFESDNVIIVDKKQGKFVVIEKKQLQELLEKRPIWQDYFKQGVMPVIPQALWRFLNDQEKHWQKAEQKFSLKGE